MRRKEELNFKQWRIECKWIFNIDPLDGLNIISSRLQYGLFVLYIDRCRLENLPNITEYVYYSTNDFPNANSAMVLIGNLI